jgi:enoyl-CoA hydratase/carnithine racemase
MTDFAHSIDVTREDTVVRIRFSSEHPANVFTGAMLHVLLEEVDAIRTDPSVRVLVIEGRDEMFSGGADLQSILDMTPKEYLDYVETEYELFRMIEELPILTICAIRGGSCIGNAAEIALACDFRVASEDIRIGWPEIHVGFVAPSQRMSRFVGIGVAKSILLTGRLLKAREAQALGLITTVVAADEVEAAIEKLVGQCAGRAPVSVRVTKAALERAYSFPPENPGLEVKAAAESYATEDCREGANAILERRTPVFAGK